MYLNMQVSKHLNFTAELPQVNVVRQLPPSPVFESRLSARIANSGVSQMFDYKESGVVQRRLLAILPDVCVTMDTFFRSLT
jgi:hypothetical protein